MSDAAHFPMPKSETELVLERDEAIRERKRLARIEHLERHGAERLVIGHQVQRVPDERYDAAMYVWRTQDGRVFTETPDVAEARPDAVAFNPMDYRYVLLVELDPDVYALAARRARDRREREHAQLSEERVRIDAERKAAPAPPIGARTTHTLGALLDQARADDVRLTVIGDRVRVEVPAVHVQREHYRGAIDALAPLIVATNSGERPVECDVDGCDDPAEVVGTGGCFLCLLHGH
jgi:hypothetical protein